MSKLETGGGVLNNALPHILAIVETLSGARVVQATGEARIHYRQAPVIDGIHDFRDWLKLADTTTLGQAEAMRWKDCDADNFFTAELELKNQDVSVGARISYDACESNADVASYIRLVGAKATLTIDELFFVRSISLSRSTNSQPEKLKVPDHYGKMLDFPGNWIQKRWSAAVRQFVNDVKGTDFQPYLTFEDGWRYQAIIESIRNSALHTTRYPGTRY